MTSLPPYPDDPDDTGDTGVGRDRGATISTPRWVKVFGIIALVLVLLVVILHLTGHGFRGLHGSIPPASAIASVIAYGVQQV